METNKAFQARETNPVDFAELEGNNPKMAETSCAISTINNASCQSISRSLTHCHDKPYSLLF